MELVLVKYHENFYYGSLDGLFICTKNELDDINGAEIYFGEVLGKHSEVYSIDVYENCEVIETSGEEMAVLVNLFGVGTISGYNPLEHLPEEDEDDF